MTLKLPLAMSASKGKAQEEGYTTCIHISGCCSAWVIRYDGSRNRELQVTLDGYNKIDKLPHGCEYSKRSCSEYDHRLANRCP